jgi:hypothetical protein
MHATTERRPVKYDLVYSTVHGQMVRFSRWEYGGYEEATALGSGPGANKSGPARVRDARPVEPTP